MGLLVGVVGGHARFPGALPGVVGVGLGLRPQAAVKNELVIAVQSDGFGSLPVGDAHPIPAVQGWIAPPGQGEGGEGKAAQLFKRRLQIPGSVFPAGLRGRLPLFGQGVRPGRERGRGIVEIVNEGIVGNEKLAQPVGRHGSLVDFRRQIVLLRHPGQQQRIDRPEPAFQLEIHVLLGRNVQHRLGARRPDDGADFQLALPVDDRVAQSRLGNGRDDLSIGFGAVQVGHGLHVHVAGKKVAAVVGNARLQTQGGQVLAHRIGVVKGVQVLDFPRRSVQGVVGGQGNGAPGLVGFNLVHHAGGEGDPFRLVLCGRGRLPWQPRPQPAGQQPAGRVLVALVPIQQHHRVFDGVGVADDPPRALRTPFNGQGLQIPAVQDAQRFAPVAVLQRHRPAHGARGGGDGGGIRGVPLVFPCKHTLAPFRLTAR
ncbi:MAG: hypothetical protein DBY38_11350 [Clostridium cadaveris]|uniref:Uncharacterized protein n=1 Tax=Clostridium cadaveris TaxID=1529 RepID=A0A316M5A3_9CLOT|nr:MAG: hypothetical protein DBY38_11350 [Clostridium cadaveris]